MKLRVSVQQGQRALNASVFEFSQERFEHTLLASGNAS